MAMRISGSHSTGPDCSRRLRGSCCRSSDLLAPRRYSRRRCRICPDRRESAARTGLRRNRNAWSGADVSAIVPSVDCRILLLYARLRMCEPLGWHPAWFGIALADVRYRTTSVQPSGGVSRGADRSLPSAFVCIRTIESAWTN